MHHLTRVSLANRAVVALLTLLFMGVGVFAAGSLKQELFPSLELPTAAVVATYPGAAPDVIEREVTRPLEDAVTSIEGVTRVSSTTTRGISQVTVQWEFGEDSDQVRSTVERAVAGLEQRLPQDVSPRVLGGSLDAIPIVSLSVTSDDDEATLARKLDEIAVPELAGIDGVRSVTVSGAREGQLVITFRPQDVKRLGVMPAMLPQALQAAGVTTPAGDVVVRGSQVDVQVGRPLTGVKDVEALRLQGTDGPVTLSRVADVTMEPVEATTISRTDGEPSLGIAVVKDTEGNTVSVSRDVADALPGIAAQLGGGAAFSTVFDQAPFIEKSIENLGTEGLLGLVFAVFVIFVFLLSVRPTIIAAISIPMSLLIALIVLRWGDQSLNIFTLGALTIAIGRVVDDSIVVIENIKRHVGLGERGFEAIVRAVREVAGAVTSSTIATVVVFLPLGLVSGEVGELFRPFALTTSIALLASLFVSLTIVPVLASWFMVPKGSGAAGAAGAAAGSGLLRRGAGRAASEHDHEAVTWLQRPYVPTLRWALAHRVITLVVAVAIFAGSMALVPRLRTDFLGDSGQDTLTLSQDMPPGTTLTVTDEAARQVEEVLRDDPAVDTVQATVGGGQEQAAFGGASGASTASMVVSLDPGESATEVGQRLRQRIATLGEQVGDVQVRSGGGPANSDVQVQVQGSELKALGTGSDDITAMMRAVPGLEEVRSDLAATTALLQVSVDPAKVAAAGMTQAEVGTAVASAVRGIPGGQLVTGETTRDILVRSQEPATTVAQLSRIELPISQKQTMDARQEAAQDVADDQQAVQERQRAQAERQAAQQVQSLREGRAQAQAQVEQLERQLRAGRAQAQAQITQLEQLLQTLRAWARAAAAAVPTTRPTAIPTGVAPPTEVATTPAPSEARQPAPARPTAPARARPTAPDPAPAATGTVPTPTERPATRETKSAVPSQPTTPADPSASPQATASGGVRGGRLSVSAATAAPTPTSTSTARGRASGPTAPALPSLPDDLPDFPQLLARQIQAQVRQLEAGLAQARKQVAALDQQIAAAQQASARGAAQAQEAQRLADATQAAQKTQATPLRLNQVASVRRVSAPATITRTDGVRTVTISATPTGGDLSATNTALRDGIAATSLPSGVTASLGGVSADQEEAFRQLGLAMLIAIAIVFLVMVATFRSLAQPLILLVSIPFAATGAVGLLLLTDTALGLPAMIGLLMLIGIVVTNAIVLIDLVNQYRQAGAGVREAIIDGARLRLRPIVMTAMATICALIPMALGLTGGGVFVSRPLAIVVIGGLVTSTILTLVLVPVLYDLLESGRQRLARRRAPEAAAA